jgi:type III secretion protein L
MALALLKLNDHTAVAVDGPVLRGAQWQWLKDLPALRGAAAHASEHAREATQAQVRAEQQQALTHAEHELQRIMLLKAMSLQVAHENFVRDVESRFVETVLSCVKSLMGEKLPSGFLERAALSAQTLLGRATPAAMVVSPGDEAAAREALLCFERPGMGTPMRLQIDAHLEPGQCHFQTANGRVQASLPVQLEALEAALQLWWKQGLPEKSQEKSQEGRA